MSTALTTTEAQRLRELEATIERGLATFVEVGAALAEVRHERLYRQSHGTFDKYVAERWQMTDRHARRLMEASSVVREIGPIGPVPASESQARALAPVPSEKRPEVWKDAVESAPKDSKGKPKVTAEHVKQAVQRSGVIPITKSGKIDKLAQLRAQREAAAAPAPTPKAALDRDDQVQMIEIIQHTEKKIKALGLTSERMAKAGLPDPWRHEALNCAAFFNRMNQSTKGGPRAAHR